MTTEEAYNLLANELIEFVADREWDCAKSVTKVYSKMTQTGYWRISGEQSTEENDKHPPFEAIGAASRAVLFLRDNLLATTGDRIWGLTFTLYPDGKFNIEYDYNKPEGYVETEEVVEVNPVELSNMAKGL